MTQNEVQDRIQDVRERLSRIGRERGMDLALVDQDYDRDEDWLFLHVIPKQKGIRAYVCAEILTDVEDELRNEGIANVYLLPKLDK